MIAPRGMCLVLELEMNSAAVGDLSPMVLRAGLSGSSPLEPALVWFKIDYT
jgi:hypothetical protein